VILRALVPSDSPEVDTDAENSGADLDRLYEPHRRRWVRLNLVASLDGGVRGPDGTSDGLTTSADRRILASIRRQADAVLVGAATVRSEGFRVPKTARLAVVTASGEFGAAVVDPLVAHRVTIYCPAEHESRIARGRLASGSPGISVVGLPARGGAVDVRSLIVAIRASGAESIVCEGGPSTAGALLDHGLVDELCLTTSPVLTGRQASLPGESDAPGPTFGGRGGTRLSLTQLLTDDSGALYARWRILPSPVVPACLTPTDPPEL
jgi:riboflavin biosynthesis pyrimidine reductase